MESKKIIEVNGKKYDAVSGTVLGVTTAPPLRTSGHNIDVFFRARNLSTQITKTPPAQHSNSIAALAKAAPSAPELKTGSPRNAGREVNHAHPHAPQDAISRTIHVSKASVKSESFVVRRGQPNHVHHHVTQHSKTLRRDSVPAPIPSTHNLLRPKGALQHDVPGLIGFKKAASSIDSGRLARAQNASKSPFIARHAAPTHTIVPMFAPVSVQPSPASSNGDTPSVPSPRPSNKPEDIFEHALATANNFVDLQGHKATYKRRAKSHVLSMTVGSLALIVIASFVAYQNNPGLQFKIASIQSGVSAIMPNFAAAGFSYNGVRSADGKVTIGFKAKNSDYTLTQANTNFSDADMIQTIGATDASGQPTYSVVNANGTTVYRFNNTNATWVSDGRWYTISGNGALTDQQLQAIIQHI
jgi:hypothetical protein